MTNKQNEGQDVQAVGGGIELIRAERQRQMDVEGWTPEHDAEHEWGELAKAAACYAVYHTDAKVVEGDEDAWPWSKEWDKRNDPNDIRNLVKAGALIAAEIDRLQLAATALKGTIDPRSSMNDTVGVYGSAAKKVKHLRAMDGFNDEGICLICSKSIESHWKLFACEEYFAAKAQKAYNDSQPEYCTNHITGNCSCAKCLEVAGRREMEVNSSEG